MSRSECGFVGENSDPESGTMFAQFCGQILFHGEPRHCCILRVSGRRCWFSKVEGASGRGEAETGPVGTGASRAEQAQAKAEGVRSGKSRGSGWGAWSGGSEQGVGSVVGCAGAVRLRVVAPGEELGPSSEAVVGIDLHTSEVCQGPMVSDDMDFRTAEGPSIQDGLFDH